jgi:hypothetical protein
MKKEQLVHILRKYLPPGMEHYAVEILAHYKIQLHLKKPRTSIYGDYTPPQPGENHRISLNYDLNPYAFLITFMHEVAHLLNFEKFGHAVAPHGTEWKRYFQVVSAPVLEKKVLPPDISHALGRYLHNPAASSCSDPLLFRTLRKYDLDKRWVLVEDIPMFTAFIMQDGKRFVKLEKNRTRYTCKEVGTGRIFLVPGLAQCMPLQENPTP